MQDPNEEVTVETEVEEELEPATETTDWAARAKKLEEKAIIQRERTRTLKERLAKLEKAAQAPKEAQKPEDNALLQKMERIALRTAGITHPDDVELARKTAEKWKVDIDEVLEDDDFKAKLERQQTKRANELATSNIQGSPGTQSAKSSPEYWIAKGAPPSATDVPDRKQRAKIARAMIDSKKGSGNPFYNG